MDLIMEGGQPLEGRFKMMNDELKTLLARALDMNETELRATLITIIIKTAEAQSGYNAVRIIKDAVDLAYNPFKRQQKIA